jgi:serine/threonine-protein kinase
MPPHSQLQLGAVLADRYQIISRLGEGGMGTVFLANDLKLSGKQWAVKESLLQVKHAQGYADEAAILVQLDHPFLPKIVDFYPPDAEGYTYLVIDYIKGHSLQKLFTTQKQLSVEQVIRYAMQLCQAFDYLHHFKPRAIIYRDLKPSNIMVDELNNIRLIDFGIARSYAFDQDADTVQLGTIGFAAPEQYEHQQTDSRTDLYSLGALMFYLLSGGHYYTPQSTFTDQLPHHISEKLQNIIAKLLQFDPEERFQKASEVYTALEKLSKESTSIKEIKTMAQSDLLITRKLILIGSLYAGAGSTFTTLSLSCALNNFHIPHAVIEYLLNEPELYALLFGERYAPKDYIFTADKIERNLLEQTPVWRNGHAEWHPLPPTERVLDCQIEQSYKLLYSIAQPIILLDISHHWTHPTVIELCQRADEIIVVTGPSLPKLNMPSTLNRINQLIDLQSRGKSVQLVANRQAGFPAQKEWLFSLPLAPICILPEFEYAEVVQSLWSGQLVQEREPISKLLTDRLLPLIKKFIPEPHLSLNILKKDTLFSKWLK